MRLTRGGTEEADVERVLGGCRFYEWGPPNADHPEQESDGTAKRSGEARGPESTRSFPPILARIKRPGRVGEDYKCGDGYFGQSGLRTKRHRTMRAASCGNKCFQATQRTMRGHTKISERPSQSHRGLLSATSTVSWRRSQRC